MTPLIERLSDVSATDLPIVGGKGANLGELARAGFPVPDGFILTTTAYAQAAEAARVDPLDPASAPERLRNTPVPNSIEQAARAAFEELGHGPVAVRSSATAEDLPGASFAGQQDTFLNIQGADALLDAIRRCWASLWNDRAVAYRAANGIDNAAVSLAVVVQRMVPASAAGVLFTADPLTGKRDRAAIEAIADLGEKLVSGAANPDHYVVETGPTPPPTLEWGVNPPNPPVGVIVERRISGREAVLSDEELRALARCGEAVEQHFGTPQDIEFAFDADRKLWVVQARPITTLYPLPADVPPELRVYFSANVFQGYFSPFTPMGTQFFQLLGTSVTRAFGGEVKDSAGGPDLLVDAGMRLFVDITAVLRNPFGRRVFETISAAGEARASVVLSRLNGDPRLALRDESTLRTVRRVALTLMRAGVVKNALRVLIAPDATRNRYVREMEKLARIQLPPNATASQRLDAFEWLLLYGTRRLLPRLLGIMAPAMLSLGLANVLLRGRARPDEIQMLTLSAPHNPTTEMDLALWSLAASLREDPSSRAALLERAPVDLSLAYRNGSLPPQLQSGLAAFLARYGFRAIGEIDIGVPRWSEDPTHLLGALANYLRLGNDSEALAPDVQFARGRQQAQNMVSQLIARMRGPRRLLLHVVLRRLRQLIGSREAPKFHIIRLLATPARELLLATGAELAVQGRLAAADDIFFLRLDEARAAAAGEDMRATVAIRRAEFDRERTRRHIPRVLLSDGTDAEAALVVRGEGGDLRGSPASPGVVTGRARVIMDPRGAHLEPGEILIAPSTDPGWTPLFLTAGGLVMEMGGMMSHGAVVAREYGIPAVVGVHGATERITTGEAVTVDGFAGTVMAAEAPTPSGV